MAWYRCSCGFMKEEAPRFGDAIVSVNHLHRSVRLDGSATIVRMEEVPFAVAAGEGSCDPAVSDARAAAHKANGASHARPESARVPGRRAA